MKKELSVPLQFASEESLKSFQEYQQKYRESLHNPEKFWSEIANEFEWFRKWDKVCSYQWKEKIEVQWFQKAQTNICLNALDRHLKKRKDKIALIWEGNESSEIRRFTYQELHAEVCKLANALKSLGVKKGERVAIYMGMVPELMIALLACARIGAVHNVIFGGFSAESLKERIYDCRASVLLTADGLYRGNKIVNLKTAADQAMEESAKEGHEIKKCLVLKRTNEKITMKEGRDLWWHDLLPLQSSESFPEVMDAEDPLFILYTSGSTGKPKGVLHSTAGYMVYVATTFKYVFDTHEEDIFWCTADIGWVTGHSYVVYGPLLNGATVLMFEGVPTYPAPDRFWEMIDRHQVSIFYTAPTAIRALMREGERYIEKHNLSSLKLLGTVGEPINPAAWLWYYEKIGKEKCPIVDTWWQTETGGILVTTLPGIMPMKPGSAGLPFFGIKPKVIREDGSECEVGENGYFVIEQPWPSMIRTVYGQPNRVKETYFTQFPGLYLSGDGAYRDEEGYIWFQGRIDDVLNVSGHRIGTAEVESALVKHPSVAEAAVVGFPHEVKGQGIHAFVTLKSEIESSEELRKDLIQQVSKEIGAIAKPDKIQFTPALPKTRSGKIMRRILRKIAEGNHEDLGDLSTLADPSVVTELIQEKK